MTKKNRTGGASCRWTLSTYRRTERQTFYLMKNFDFGEFDAYFRFLIGPSFSV